MPAECRDGLSRRSWPATGTRSSCSTGTGATRCGHSRRRPRRAGSRLRRRRRPTRCCRCWRRVRGCGCSSTPAFARTGGASAGTGGFWLPECAYAPGLEWRLAEHGGALVLRRPERPRASRWRRWRRSRPRRGRSPSRSTGRRSSWLWSLDGYPSDPAHAQFAGKSLRGMRIWKVGGGAYDPAAAEAAARRQAGEFLAAAAARLREFAERAAAAGCWSSRSTPSCSATGGRRARSGCARCSTGPPAPGSACSPSREALAEHEPGRAAACAPRPGVRTRTCAPGTRRRSPTSPGGRAGWSCGCCARSRAGLARRRRERAARELLAVQASDWAFLDKRRPGGRLRLPAGDRPRRGRCSRP